MNQEALYHITRYNLKRIFKGGFKHNYKIDEPYYIKEIPRLEQERINDILWIKMFLKSADEVSEIIESIKEEDKYQYLFKSTSPAFHSITECDLLNQDYFNYELPEGIKENQEAVERCRLLYQECASIQELIEAIKNDAWFQSLFESLDININTLTIDSFPPINKSSSGSGYFYFRNGAIEYDEYIIEKHDRITKNRVVRKVNNKEDIVEVIDDVLVNIKTHYVAKVKGGLQRGFKAFDSIFKPGEYKNYYLSLLSSLIIEYHILDLNPGLSFPLHLLNQLGFHPCSSCIQGDIEIKPLFTIYGKPSFGLCGIPDDLNDNEDNEESIPYENSEPLSKFNILTYYGVHEIRNTPKTALDIDELKYKTAGIYYSKHKFGNLLQMAMKYNEGYSFHSLPVSGSGKDVLAKKVHVYFVKPKDLSEKIKGEGTLYFFISAD